MITYFKDKNHKFKKNFQNYKTSITLLKSFDIIVIIATTSGSITLSLTGLGLIAIPISAATTCGLSIGNKVVYENIVRKYKEYKKRNEKDEQVIKYFDKLHRNSLQDNLIDNTEI